MAEERGYLLGEKALKQINQLIAERFRLFQNETPKQGRFIAGRDQRAVILDAALEVATHALTGATSALATRCVWSQADEEYTETTQQITVWNHSTDVRYDAGKFGYAVWQDGHWHFTPQGGALQVYHGKIHESHGQGYYTVELRSWSGQTPDCDSDPNCTPCRQMTGSLSTSVDDVCGDIVLPELVSQTVETTPAVYVLAYHRASQYVPLIIGSECVMIDMGDSNPIANTLSGLSASVSGYDDEPVFQIIDGIQEHTVQYKDTYECCGTGEDVLTKRTAIIFAALVCDEVICNPCNGA